MGEDLELFRLARRIDLLGINRDDNALRAELFRRLADEIRVLDRCRVDRHLVGSCNQELADVFHGPDPAADGDRHETGFRRAPDNVIDRVPALVAGGDVQKAEFVGTGGIIGLGGLDRVAGIDQIDKIDALDDTAVLHVQAGNDTGFEGHDCFSLAARIRSIASFGSRRPSYNARPEIAPSRIAQSGSSRR